MPDYDRLTDVTSRLADVREDARAKAVRAIRRMEAALAEALGGETLSGLPNINPGRRSPAWRGLRLRTRHLDEPLSTNYRGAAGWTMPALCLDRRGQLVMVRRNSYGDVGVLRVGDDDLKAEDVETVAAVIVEAVDLHNGHASERTAQFDRLRRLADGINTLLEEID